MAVENKEIKVIDIATGKQSKKLEIPLLKQKNENESHHYYLLDKFQKANQRTGTASTKNRSAVSGGGAKPYRQKGTGHARRGTNRSPLVRGGGVIFGPTPRNYSHSLNSKLIKSTIMSAMAAKSSSIYGITTTSDKIVKTQAANSVLEENKISGKTLVLLTTEDTSLEKSLRNLTTIKIASVRNIPVQTLIQSEHILISESAIGTLQEIWK